MTTNLDSGYRPCACRDCMETAIGEPGAFCHECEDAGCAGNRECQAAEAYGGAPETPAPERLTAALIRARCEHAGFFVIADTDALPALVISRMLEALRALAPEMPALPGLDAIPEAAAGDEAHPWWDSAESATALAELSSELLRWAPPGFTLAVEGDWHLGFFRC